MLLREPAEKLLADMYMPWKTNSRIGSRDRKVLKTSEFRY